MKFCIMFHVMYLSLVYINSILHCSLHFNELNVNA